MKEYQSDTFLHVNTILDHDGKCGWMDGVFLHMYG